MTHKRYFAIFGACALLLPIGLACNSSKPEENPKPGGNPSPEAVAPPPKALDLLRKGEASKAIEEAKASANLNEQDAKGATFLSVALGLGDVKAVQTALEKGAQLDVKDLLGATPLLIAIREGDKTQRDKTPQFEAYAVHETTTSVQKANFPGASGGSSETLFGPSAASRKEGKEAFFNALKLAIAKGADINALDKSGRGVLFYAVNDPEMFDFLMAQGAKFPVQAQASNSVFGNAIQQGLKEPVSAILKQIAQAKPEDKSAMLANAIHARRPELVKLLLEKGCAAGGATQAVSAAVDAHYTEGLALLQSAKVAISPQVLQESLSASAHFGALSDAEEALNQGVSPNFVDSHGMTPLNWAVSGGDERMLAILMKYHPNINFPDGKGRTAVDLAKKRKSPHMLEMLQGGK